MIFKRCASCHRSGGKAMSLVHYEEARPWAKAIKEEVLERRMPPWGAVKGFGEFLNDRGLTQEEISIFADWVEGGAPEGEAKYAPEIPLRFEEPPTRKGRFQQIALDATLTLSRDELLQGIRPTRAVSDASVRIFAQLPDGSLEPLLWLKNYKPEWGLSYFFVKPVTLPKGSQIFVQPSGRGTLNLLTSNPVETKSPPKRHGE